MEEVLYDVKTDNKFSLLFDENADPYDAIKQIEAVKKSVKINEKVKPKPKENVKLPVTPAKVNNYRPARNNESRGGSNFGRRGRGDDYNHMGRGGSVPPRYQRMQESNETEPVRPSYSNFENEGAPRYERSEGGGYRGRGVFRGRLNRGRGRRDFERRSGSDKTGIKPQEKREGSGSHNWGNMNDDVKAVEDHMQNGATEEVVQEEEVEKRDASKEDESPPVREETKPVITLEEYKREKAKDLIEKNFNVRRANEGSMDFGSKRKYTVRQRRSVEIQEDEVIEEGDDEKDVRDITDQFSIVFKDTNTRGFGRGRGRGGPRGRGTPRGGFQENRHGFKGDVRGPPKPVVDEVIDIESQREFPSLK